jgi:hypothetical protein
MRSMWIKIGLGAGAVFALGMMVVTLTAAAGSAAKAAVHGSMMRAGQALASAAAGSDLPFMLGGARLGTIRNIDIQRTTRGELPEVHLVVDLSSPELSSHLADCVLIPAHDGHFKPDQGFRCANASETDRATIGLARFEPGAMNRPIRVGPALAQELRQGDPFAARADLGGQVRISAKGDSGELVDLLADSGGVSLQVRDQMQRAVLRLLADSTGASLRVRGDDGKVVRLEANQSGLTIRVDSATSP